MQLTHIEFSLLTSQEGRAIPKLVAEIIHENDLINKIASQLQQFSIECQK